MPAPVLNVGPVIGEVTATTARVLVELDRDGTLTALARSEQGDEREARADLERHRPGVLRFQGLQPGRTYRLAFEGVREAPPGRFRTPSDSPTGLNLGVVSCNFTIRKGTKDLWADLCARYVRPGELDLLLHVGDQVYGDTVFQEAIGQLAGRSAPTRTQERRILDAYRDLYRWTWRHPPTREVLANVSNLMIWDDHEIRDDWGSREEDRDPASLEQIVGRLAWQVYREYTRQLWDDAEPDALPELPSEDHRHVWGPFGVLFLDQRGGRSFGYHEARPYLGRAQWQRLEADLGDAGRFAGVRALVVVTSVPLAYLGDVITTRGDFLANDLRDHWSYGPHQKEQIEMVRALRRWAQRRPGERELLVVGGDVHLGGHTRILHRNQVAFRQLITSPITNTPPPWILFQGLRALLEVDQGLGETYRFEHSEFTNRRNYGIVLLRSSPNAPPHIDASLVLE